MDVISIRDFSRTEIEELIWKALEIKQGSSFDESLKNVKVASLFFEDSTRTRISSETAATDLFCTVKGFSGVEGTSVKKGEPFVDTLRMFAGYGNKAIILRHGLEGAARLAADILPVSVINSGDGCNGHPTQTLLDLMTLKEVFGTIDGLRIALVGDLKYGRTVHSLLQGLGLYDVEVWLISPPSLAMPTWRVEDYQQATGKKVAITPDLKEAIKKVDVLYMTRIQRERFPAGPEGELEYKQVSGSYNLKAAMLKEAREHLIVLHPLPRYKHNLEVAMDVDKTKHAKYFQQAENGLFMRQAVLKKVILGLSSPAKVEERKEELLWQELPIKDGQKKGEHMIYRLDNGILIDHIEGGKGLKVYKILGLDEKKETTVVPALGIRSQSFGKKDVLAIHDFNLTPEQLYKVTLISPGTTINYIKEGKVVKKGRVVLPKIVEGLILCNNPNCISHPAHNEHIPSWFYVESSQPLKVRCHYCEKPMEGGEIELLI